MSTSPLTSASTAIGSVFKIFALSAFAVSSFRWSRPQMATRTPRARPKATALPMPSLEAVTKATLPSKPASNSEYLPTMQAPQSGKNTKGSLRC